MQEAFFMPTRQLSLPLLIVFMVWSLFWKGKALWKSAKYEQKYWFITLLIVNTLGILEIIYLAFFQQGYRFDFKKIPYIKKIPFLNKVRSKKKIKK